MTRSGVRSPYSPPAPAAIGRTASQTAITATDREREEAQAVYAEAQLLAVDICDTVEFHFRRDPQPAQSRQRAPLPDCSDRIAA